MIALGLSYTFVGNLLPPLCLIVIFFIFGEIVLQFDIFMSGCHGLV
jgi:hypothetical protein